MSDEHRSGTPADEIPASGGVHADQQGNREQEEEADSPLHKDGAPSGEQMDEAPRFAPTVDSVPVHPRSAFSHNALRLGSVRVMSLKSARNAGSRRFRRAETDQKLPHLLDDLNDRPLDQLYSDAGLTRSKPESAASRFLSHSLVFLLCTAIGIASVAAVRQLHRDSRRRVRSELASQAMAAQERESRLKREIETLSGKVDATSRKLLAAQAQSESSRYAALQNGTQAVEGPGIVITLAVPGGGTTPGFSPHSSGSSPGSGGDMPVSDTDLQSLVNALWASGAEAMSVNGERIGSTTSIRTAGSSILVGLQALSAPYTIEAIGNQSDLMRFSDSGSASSLVQELRRRGVDVSVQSRSRLRLGAREGGTTEYSRSGEQKGGK